MFVHFDGWDDKFDEWIEVREHRLKEPTTQTASGNSTEHDDKRSGQSEDQLADQCRKLIFKKDLDAACWQGMFPTTMGASAVTSTSLRKRGNLSMGRKKDAIIDDDISNDVEVNAIPFVGVCRM